MAGVMPDSSNVQAQIGFYRDEITDREFYKRLAESVEDQSFKENLSKLSRVEEEHSKFWKKHLEEVGQDLSKVKHRRGRVLWLLFLSKLIGNYLTVRLLEHGEINTVKEYSDYIKSSSGSTEFRNGLQNIINEEIEHEEVFQNQMEKNQDQIEKNRDIIYGVSDGLVEVLGAVAGLAAIITNHYYVALGGILVGLSGTISMSLGAYLSKNSETEFRINEEKQKELLGQKSDEEQIRQYSKQSKKSAAAVGGSYIIGAAVPILPFVFLSPIVGLIVAVVAVALSQALTNALVALSLNISMLRNSIKASLLSLSAAAAVFTLGEIFHVLFHITLL